MPSSTGCQVLRAAKSCASQHANCIRCQTTQLWVKKRIGMRMRDEEQAQTLYLGRGVEFLPTRRCVRNRSKSRLLLVSTSPQTHPAKFSLTARLCCVTPVPTTSICLAQVDCTEAALGIVCNEKPIRHRTPRGVRADVGSN